MANAWVFAFSLAVQPAARVSRVPGQARATVLSKNQGRRSVRQHGSCQTEDRR